MRLINDPETLDKYSRDASIFEVTPKYVAVPENVAEIKELIQYAKENSESLTVRAGGSDMTGGPLNNSIIVDIKNFNKIGEVKVEPGLRHADPRYAEGSSEARAGYVLAEAGVFYRDFEDKTLHKGLILPCYPASKNLAALGGMISNNCGGEKTLRYGKMEEFVLESKYIFSDGNEYVVRPKPIKALETWFEKELFNLIRENREIIEKAKPKVSKNSSGYFLWNVVDWQTGMFDLNRLLTGAQGTLGILTEAKVRLVREKKHHDMVVLFFKSWDELPKVVNAILPFEPEDLETFDDDTLKLGLRFMPEVAKKAKTNLLSFASKFLPEALIGIRMLGLPELIVLVEIAEDDEKEVKRKVEGIVEAIKPFNVWHKVIEKDSEEEKFWIMRRESFNLLREHSQSKKTVPIVDDFCIKPELIPKFLPKTKKILEESGIDVNIAGHAGNGNFHIIPLMDLKDEGERAKLIPVAERFYDLVAQYEGSNSGEHNDGIVRTPFLGKMYPPEVLELFKKTKQIFDPQNIFNPGKKVPSTGSGQVGGTLEYLENHIIIG